MSKKYKHVLMSLLVLIILTIYIGFDYQNYLSEAVNTSERLLVLPSSDINVSYLSGNEIDYTKNAVTKIFTVTNTKSEPINWNINLVNTVELSEQKTATIKIQENGLVIYEELITLDSYNELMNNITLESNITNEYIISIECQNIETTGKIHINTINETKNELANKILSNNKVEQLTTVVGELSTTEEGLIKGIDEYKETYYFRGISNNNYVSFANYNWRIVRIEGNGNVKLILDEELGDLNSFYSKDSLIYDESNAYVILNEWYNEILKEYDEKLDPMNIVTEETLSSTNYYASYDRLNKEDYTINPTGTESTSKIGLISVDEIIYAGGSIGEENENFYLADDLNINYIATNTLLNKNTSNNIYVLNTKTGSVVTYNAAYDTNLRPVISINDKIEVSGNGTPTDPYVLK